MSKHYKSPCCYQRKQSDTKTTGSVPISEHSHPQICKPNSKSMIRFDLIQEGRTEEAAQAFLRQVGDSVVFHDEDMLQFFLLVSFSSPILPRITYPEQLFWLDQTNVQAKQSGSAYDYYNAALALSQVQPPFPYARCCAFTGWNPCA